MLLTLALFLSTSALNGFAQNEGDSSKEGEVWTFTSIPDFLNFDINYPQQGWEDALGYIVDSMKNEKAEFVMVAGDLVMGRWGTSKESVDKWAEKYYPPWKQRFKDRHLPVYAALGDHEIGDNPWKGKKAAAVPHYKKAFKRYLNMPLNGPEHMKGTAFYWVHKNALFISVDVFEKGKSKQGAIRAGVTGEQLKWFEEVLAKYRSEVDHIIVMGHTPILRPVRTFSSSGMLTAEDHRSDFWKTMVKYQVDLYICGEVHAITCTEKDGILQVAHGGLIGRTESPNYMLVTVHKDQLELNMKEISLVNGTKRLWQHNKSGGPWDTIEITKERKADGFASIGYVQINKTAEGKVFEEHDGCFNDPYSPKQKTSAKKKKANESSEEGESGEEGESSEESDKAEEGKKAKKTKKPKKSKKTKKSEQEEG